MLNHYITILEFSSGERISIANQIRAIALDIGAPHIVALAERSLAHDHATRRMDTSWANQLPSRMYTPKMTQLDNTVDPVITSIRDIARGHVRGLPAGHPLIERVDAMLADIFPAGAGAIVSLAFVDQAAAMEVLVEQLQTVHAGLVAELGLTARVAYLAELTITYREVLDHGRNVAFDDIDAMRTRGQSMMRELLAVIMGQYYNAENPDHVAKRNELLAPVTRETELVRVRRMRRRANGETTGETGSTETGGTETGGTETGDTETGGTETGGTETGGQPGQMAQIADPEHDVAQPDADADGRAGEQANVVARTISNS